MKKVENPMTSAAPQCSPTAEGEVMRNVDLDGIFSVQVCRRVHMYLIFVCILNIVYMCEYVIGMFNGLYVLVF